MRLSKEDWNKLDDLLGKIGFGGYYDLLEVLKIGAYQLCDEKLESEKKRKYKTTIRFEGDLKFLVLLVNFLIFKEKRSDKVEH